MSKLTAIVGEEDVGSEKHHLYYFEVIPDRGRGNKRGKAGDS